MLLRLVKDHLRPYSWSLLAIVTLQLLGTVMMLLLPSLNADIIDNGIVKGDTDYILRFGGLMLLISFFKSAARSLRCGSLHVPRWAWVVTSGPQSSDAWAPFRPRNYNILEPVANHPRDQ